MKAHDPSPAATLPPLWQRSSAALRVGFQAYSGWLVRMGWLRLVLLSLALPIGLSGLNHLPPLNWRIAERTVETSRRADAVWGPGSVHISRPGSRYELTVDERGVRIQPTGADAPSGTASGAAPAAQAAEGAGQSLPSVTITLPRGSPAAAELRAAIDGAVADLHAARQRTLAVTVGDVLFNLAHDAGAGGAAFPVQHTGFHRTPDRNRPAARRAHAAEPDRHAARLHAHHARGHGQRAARPGAGTGCGAPLSGTAAYAHGRTAARGHRRAPLPRMCPRALG